MNSYRKYPVAIVLAGAVLFGTACSGSSDGGGVASIAAGGAASGGEPAEVSARQTEDQLVAYTQCLRDQGLDVADPEVDAEGNLTMGRPRFGGGGGDGTGGGGFNRDAFVKAQETCGEPPAGGFGRSGVDASVMQDTMLAFAGCMRGEGLDVPDPDFSGASGGAGGMFGALDRDDPEVAAAMESCQSVFAGAGFGGNGGAGR